MEKIEILQKFLLSLVPEEWKGDAGWQHCREEMIKNIKEADLEKLLHLLQ